MVTEIARREPRVRLESAPALPAGWCGKQHACHAAAKLARYPLLVFVDADVRLRPDALARMCRFLERTEAGLASGVPRQETGTFSERLLLPLIHFILLGYLPMFWARRSSALGFAAGCGQLFVVQRDAYWQSGGHQAIRSSLHDGIQLPRAFRRAGFGTELFDATDVAVCRMYQSNGEVWRGLGKNATEGLAAPRTIVPMTSLLLGGEVLPTILFLSALLTAANTVWLGLVALVLSLAPRWIAVLKFRQPVGSAFLHPPGVLALLGIQWGAWGRAALGRSSVWKGRAYHPGPQGSNQEPEFATHLKSASPAE